MPASYILRKYEVSRTTLWRWRRAGLPVLQVGAKLFIKEGDIAQFIADQSAKK